MNTPIVLLFIILLSSCQKVDDIGVLVPPTVDQDSGLPSVGINVAGRDRLIHVRTYGNPGNPVLFVLHGTYSDVHSYRSICEGISDKYFVVAWDQRGCGLSERIDEIEFTLESAIEEINKMKEIYAPDQKISLLGHSWGGGLATYYTSKFPELVSQLLLIEPMPLTGQDMQHVFKSLVDFSYFNGSWNSLARHGHALSPSGHAQVDYRAMMILRSDMTGSYHCDGNNPPEWPIHRVGAFVEMVRNKRLYNAKTGFKYDFRSGITNFKEKVLVLGGSCSSLGYEMQKMYTKPHFYDSEAIEIKDAGHRMNIDKIEEVMGAIKSFLKAY